MAVQSEQLTKRERREAIRALPWVFLSLFGVAAAMAIAFVVMRVVMQMGGSCASGGPYVSARPCPDLVWLLPVGIVGGAFLGLVYFFVKPARAPSFTSLFWPALFLSLGWNFLEFGLWPPGPPGPPGRTGLDWGWLVCAIVFGLMGGAPLLALLLAEPRVYLRRVFWGATEPLISPPGLEMTPLASVPRSAAAKAQGPVVPKRMAPKIEDVSVQLERLAKLHKSGSLTDAEFEAAKQRVLDAGKRS
jgi:hypothetical protein